MNKNSWRDVTEAELAATGKVKRPLSRTASQRGLEPTTLPQGKSKYRNVKTVGHDKKVYDSAKEAARAADLAILQTAGHIRDLRRQVRFACLVQTPKYPHTAMLGDWIADFVYEELQQPGAWIAVAEDVKGMKTPLYRWKKKHVEAQYGIQIRET